MAINAQELQGQWNTLRGRVKEKWGQLSDDDLTIQNGNVEQLVGRIQQKTGEGREAIERFLGDLTARGGSAVSSAAESVGQFAQHAGERLRDQYGQWSDQARAQIGPYAAQARERYEAAEDMVRHNPGQSVAVAFGVGLALGVVVGLALRSR
jgi:uncharacterized protein YjbJ (UPF0337 family)